MFLGVYWNHPVCPSVCVQNTSFCQRAGGGINLHLATVTALVSAIFNLSSANTLKFGPVPDFIVW